METSKEKQFLKIIKFMPSIFVIFFSIFVILFLYFENKNTFNENSEKVLILRKGTGIFRIKKILNNDLFCDNILEYKYIETDAYESKKGFELKLILIDEELSNEKNINN